MSIIVYSKPSCVQCNATYRMLDKLGAEYEVVDVSTDTEARTKVVEMGYQQAPVVVAGEQHWSGYRPDLLKEVALAYV